MKILSIETAGNICAVALTEDDKLIKEELLDDSNTHSVKLMPLMDKILSETNTKISDIDLFACDIGPGSFTGIRIGLSTIKAFMDVTNKKAIGVTSLEILAENIKEEGLICVLIDAKNDNVYYALFEKTNNTCRIIENPKFYNINNIINIVKNKNEKIFFVGSGSIVYKDMIESKLINAKFSSNIEDNYLNARNIGIIAFRNQNKAVFSDKLTPLYLRSSNAERNIPNKQ